MSNNEKARIALLEAAGLDVAYERAEGDWLSWTQPGRGECRALDFVGAFGATLLGHNHPELVDVAADHLARRAPVMVQGSRRRPSEELAQRLAALLEREAGRAFEVLLLNTGTEAVEAARKHALLELTRRLDALHAEIERDLQVLRRAVERRELVLDRHFYGECERVLGAGALDSLDALGEALFRSNRQVFEAPGVCLAMHGAFHGKTLGSLELTWNPEARRPFTRGEQRSVFVCPGEGSLDELVAQHARDLVRIDLHHLRLVRERVDLVAAVFVEPIRGEGGVVPLEPDEIEALADLRARHPDVPLVVDEIQTGLGRTGRLFEGFACGLPADYVTLGKALGGGLVKLSALAVARERFHPEFTMLHSSTYAEDELSSVVGLRALELIEREDVPGRCQRLGEALLEQLHELQRRWPGQIAAVRGRGAMVGVELHRQHLSSSNVIRALSNDDHLTLMVAGYLLHEHGLRVLPTLGNSQTLRLEPSALLDPGEIPRVVGALERVCELLARANAHRLLRHLVSDDPLDADEPVADFSRDADRFETGGPPRARAAFMGHFIAADHMPLHDPSLAAFSPDQLKRLLQRSVGVVRPHIYARRIIHSPTGAETELSFIGIMMSSEQVKEDMVDNSGAEITSQVEEALALAKRVGCSVVGFGGFTSIASRNCTCFTEPHVALTTGNALTVGMGQVALREAAKEMGLTLQQQHAAVCGAAGNIGEVYACLLACDVDGLTLIGRPGSMSRLQVAAARVARELAVTRERGEQGGGLLARFSEVVDPRPDPRNGDGAAMLQEYEERAGEPLVRLAESLDALPDAGVIVTASNMPQPIILPEHVSGDRPVLLCDVAIPGDVAPSVQLKRPGARVIRGGVVALRNNPDFSIPGIPLPHGQTFACLGETIVLALSGVGIDYSRGPISTDQVREIVELARLHGVVLGSFKVQASL